MTLEASDYILQFYIFYLFVSPQPDELELFTRLFLVIVNCE